MSEPVVSYEAFRDRLLSSYWAAMAIQLEDRPAVAALIRLARARLEDFDTIAELEGRATSDEVPIPDLIREALGLWRQGMLAGNSDLLAVGYALLEKAVRRQVEEEFD
jgi:hypothetical protein